MQKTKKSVQHSAERIFYYPLLLSSIILNIFNIIFERYLIYGKPIQK